MIIKGPDSGKILWLLWACKEAAYKAALKIRRNILWAPSKYEVQLSDELSENDMYGTVDTPHERITIEIHSDPTFIHCIGSSGNSGNLRSITKGVARLPRAESSSDLSKAVRKAIIESLATCTGKEKDDISIFRQPGSRGLGPPFVKIGGNTVPIDISMSHDGSFVAYAHTALRSSL